MAMRAQGNSAHKAQVTLAIEEQVRVLEDVVANERPYFPGLPRSMNQFREWENQELGLVKIGSSTSTNEKCAPHNAALVARACKAMETIDIRRRNRKLRVYKPVGTRVEELERELKQMKEVNRRLMSEVATYLHQYAVAIDRLSGAEAERESALAALDEFRNEHIRATSLKPRRVK